MTRNRTAREGLLRGSLLFLLILLALEPRPRSAAAEAASTGVLAGVVLDQEDRQPLPNARVALYRMSPGDSVWTMVKEGLTDAKGPFRYTVPAGTYRLILYAQSYTVNVRDDVVVAPGATVEISATLTPRPLEIKGVEVQGEQKHDTETSALAKRKKAEVVTDVISAEQISKSTDANAAEALQRVTGLSLVGGRYVYVRGMGERYSSTQVNGASLGTPEPNKRVVPLDLFPSGTLDEIVVQKTYSPDQEGEFAGGVIQLHTRDAVEGRRLAQSLSTGYSSPTLGGKRLTYSGGSLDFLGYDDGTRDLPDAFRKVAGSSRLVSGGVFGGGLTPAQIQAAGRSFNKTWSPRRDDSRPNYGYSGTYSQALRVFGKALSFVGSLSLSNNIANRDRDNNAYAGTSTRLTPLYLYKVEETTRNTLGGALANWNLRLANGHSIGLRALYTRSSEDNARIMQGPNFNFGAPLVRVSSLQYVERGLFSSVASGEHTIAPLGALKLDWRAGYSEAVREEPDRRENVYEATGDGVLLSRRVQTPLTRVFGTMNEYDRSGAANLTKTFNLPGSRTMRLKTGGFLRHRNRISGFRRLGFRLGSAYTSDSTLNLSLPPEQLLVDANIKPGWFQLVEETRENDQYRAKQHVLAGYGMGEVEVGSGLTVQGGVRQERSDQAVEARSPFVTNSRDTDARLIDNDLLPAANVIWRLSERMNTRVGYSVTVSRPELREMSPFDMYDYETGYTEIGNPEIKSTRIQNYDLRWELYPGTRELLSVSGFRKLLFQPIENVVLGTNGGYTLAPRNGRDGRVSGVEIEARVGLSRIWDSASHFLPIGHSSAFDRWAVSMNYARIESSVRVNTRLNEDGSPYYRKGPLQGQSTYSLNAGIYYGSNAMDASLLLSSFGKRLAQVGAGATQSSLPDIYEHPPLSLDMTVSRSLFGPARVKISAENLLDRATEFRQLDKVTRRYRSGRTVSVAMSLRG